MVHKSEANPISCPNFAAVPEEAWQRCQLIYICTPGNPSGAVITPQTLQELIRLSDKFNFVIASDECYSEIYPDEKSPPCGLLQAASRMGATTIAIACLSQPLQAFQLARHEIRLCRRRRRDNQEIQALQNISWLRHVTTVPESQHRSLADEEHVILNRQLYKRKFDLVIESLRAA